ncbi:hypothetical protein G9409_01995 [Chlorobium sp. BLA1]|uniref:hypothetical protein n=1 Tax=Candidatus Chlorobium masyuteum TaxID=2716876 RepID=UPI001423C862|nr:hypothetical protein [Candidatus Chlorobium masyuteum]NHQ59376.1 hypothetical protein [Candidatus Chlorobium masyuteum]NTU45151.1 hypothetical protein [Chlorobiaceae bacterium]
MEVNPGNEGWDLSEPRETFNNPLRRSIPKPGGSEIPGSERSPEATIPSEREFVFDLEFSDEVLTSRLKPTTETTKKRNTSIERQMLRAILQCLLFIGVVLEVIYQKA